MYLNLNYLHVRYTGWLGFGQRLSIGPERRRRVNEGAVLFEPLRDLPVPLEPSDGRRVERRQKSKVGVEVVDFSQVAHDFDELDYVALSVFCVFLLEDARTSPGNNFSINICVAAERFF